MPAASANSFIAAASWLLSPGSPPLSGGAIAVSEGKVIASGTLKELQAVYSIPVVEYPGCAIVPGFINAHTHLELTHFPSWKIRTNVDFSPQGFVDWVIQLIKIKRGLTADNYRASICEGVRMCLESGTTAVGEIAGNSFASISGDFLLGGRIFFEVLGNEPSRFRDLLERSVEASVDLLKGVTAGLSPHSPYTLSEECLHMIRETSVAHQLPLAIHLSESSAETDFVFNTTGPLAEELYPFVGWEQYLTPPRRCSSTELMDRAGLLTPSTLAVHCVHVTMADAEILKKRGVSIVLCPRSNDRLDVGRAPVHLFRKLGIPLTLGTDSLASNDTLSIWDEMRYTLDLFKGDLSPTDLFQMVTRDGAKALGLEADRGSLEVARYADFQVIGNIDGNVANLLERIIFAGRLHEVYVKGTRFTGIS